MEVKFGVKKDTKVFDKPVLVHRISELQITYLKVNMFVFLEKELTLFY
jgi:hypothetical protein